MLSISPMTQRPDRQQLRAARRRFTGAQIVNARRDADLSQRALAALIGVTRNQLQEYEHGKHYPEGYLELIAEATGKPISYFLIETPPT